MSFARFAVPTCRCVITSSRSFTAATAAAPTSSARRALNNFNGFVPVISITKRSMSITDKLGPLMTLLRDPNIQKLSEEMMHCKSGMEMQMKMKAFMAKDPATAKVFMQAMNDPEIKSALMTLMKDNAFQEQVKSFKDKFGFPGENPLPPAKK